MASIVYLYPVHPPVRVLPKLPDGFQLDPEQIERLPVKTAEDFLCDLLNHRLFTKPQHREHRSAIQLAIEEYKSRLEKDPDEPRYFAVTRDVAKVLQECITNPVFLTSTDGQIGWERGFVLYTPEGAEAFAVFEDMIKQPQNAKPTKPAKDEATRSDTTT